VLSYVIRILVVVALLATGVLNGVCQSAAPRVVPPPKLIQALICEDIKDSIPAFPAVTFPISAGKVYCYTFFDQLSEDTVVYHQWFFRDKPSSRIRLPLKQPRWTTYSSIQLREADKGPWRVEISDTNGRVLKTLRFSVTD